MTLHYNRASGRPKRKTLRQDAPEPELKLWWHLKGKQLGVKFRRQYSVDAFIIDFYAPSCKLAIEVDGDSHFIESGPDYDRQRTAHLERFGIEVVRFTNADIFENIEGVLAEIGEAVKRRSKPPLAPP